MSTPKEIAEKILNCKTYNIPEMQNLARAYLELEKKLQVTNNNWPHEKKLHDDFKLMSESFNQAKEENARLILHINDIEKCNDNCQTKIASLESEITKLKKSREGLRTALEHTWPGSAYAIDVDAFNRNALKADDELMG